MAFEGYVDRVGPNEISGWVYNNSLPDEPLRVEVLAGDAVITDILADGFRPDLKAANKGDGRHAFSYRRPAPFPSGSPALSVRVKGHRWRIPPGGGYPIARSHYQLNHSLEFGLPAVAHAFADIPAPTSNDDDFLRRIVEAYRRANHDAPRQTASADVWSGLHKVHGVLASMLDRGDLRTLGGYLRDAHARDITFGITQGELATRTLRTSPDAAKFVVTQAADSLVSLAEHLGILDVESAEQQGRWAENLHVDPEFLVDAVRRKVGVPVVPPGVIGSLFGLKTSAGVLSGRDIFALYAALRIRDACDQSGIADASVCEIGAGHGGVAYYSALLGRRRYTIVDLPIVNVLHSYYLLKALPGRAIQLYGEPVAHDDAIVILPAWAFDARPVSCDVLFNMDSFPEMHVTYAHGYLRRALALGVRRLLSINQEARARQTADRTSPCQTPVRELVAAVGGYEHLHRFRTWAKPGYVEELYRVRES